MYHLHTLKREGVNLMSRSRKNIYLNKKSPSTKTGKLDTVNQHRLTQDSHNKKSGSKFETTSRGVKWNLNDPIQAIMFASSAYLIYKSFDLPAAAAAKVSATPTTKAEIRNLVQNKMIVGEGLTAENCNHASEAIVEAATNKNFNTQSVLSILHQPSFTWKCEQRSPNNEVGGFFNFEKNRMTILVSREPDPRKTQSYVPRHELGYHANNFYSLKDGPCHGTGEEMLALVYPRTDKEIKKYHDAIDKGDKRIKKFFDIAFGKLSEKITIQHKNFFFETKKALKNCIPYIANIIIDEKQYLMYHGQIGSALFQDAIIQHVFKDQFSTPRLVIKITSEEAFAAYLIRFWFPYVNSLYDSSKHSKFLILAEKEASRFQDFTEEAKKKIYPEAFKLREEYLERCVNTPKSKREL